MYFFYLYIFIFPSVFSRTLKIHGTEYSDSTTHVINIPKTTTHLFSPFDIKNSAIYPSGSVSSKTDTSVSYGIDTEIPAGKNEYPYQVSILKNTVSDQFEYKCCGALISNSHVLTAANCIEDKNDIEKFIVLYGQIDLISHADSTAFIEDFTIYENYSSEGGSHNIAIISLKSSLTFSDSVQAAPIFNEYPPNIQECRVSGWRKTNGDGYETREILTGTAVNLSSSCKGYDTEYPSNLYVCSHKDHKEACFVDSGRPLFCPNGGLVGIGGPPSKCDGYAIYTRVKNYYQWIKSVIESDKVLKQPSSRSLHLKQKIDLIMIFIFMQFIFNPSLLIHISI